MIVAFSTSSAWASVALLEETGELIGGDRLPAMHRASGVCLELLEKLLSTTGRSLTEADKFAADLGPGSFTGVRVGVTLAKTLAWEFRALASGADAFDLIDPEGTVVLPSKRGEYFVRMPGTAPFRTTELPAGPYQGFGFEGGEAYPDAAGFQRLMTQLSWHEPMQLNPKYLIEPSISLPKRPFPGAIRG